MRTVPNLAVALLLSSTLAVPTATAQIAGADGDWEGTWRCEAVDGAGASTSTTIATISGNRIKLSRATDANDVVLNGTIDAHGAVTLAGRGIGPDGQPMLSDFTGMLSTRSLTASGRAVPLGGGAVQTCALALAPVGTPVGPTVLRGSGAPASDSPTPAPDTSGPPIEAYPSAVWYDNDIYWRRQRLSRWEHWRRVRERRRHHQLPACEPGQIASPGSCRPPGPANAIGPTPPARTRNQAAGAPPPATAPVASPPGPPQVLGPPRATPQDSRLPAAPAVAPTPPPTAATQGVRPTPVPGSNAPSASFGAPTPRPAPAQGPTSSRPTGFGPPACSPGQGSRGRC